MENRDNLNCSETTWNANTEQEIAARCNEEKRASERQRPRNHRIKQNYLCSSQKWKLEKPLVIIFSATFNIVVILCRRLDDVNYGIKLVKYFCENVTRMISEDFISLKPHTAIGLISFTNVKSDSLNIT